MFRTWEEKVKFRFGNNTNLEGCEVNVPGIPDNRAKNIEDCFHTMAQYVTGSIPCGYLAVTKPPKVKM